VDILHYSHEPRHLVFYPPAYINQTVYDTIPTMVGFGLLSNSDWFISIIGDVKTKTHRLSNASYRYQEQFDEAK
jgi:hypothetical protein